MTWKQRALTAVGADPSPAPDFGGKLPLCSESCPHHDGKRCELMGFRPGQFCEPVLEAITDLVAHAEAS